MSQKISSMVVGSLFLVIMGVGCAQKTTSLTPGTTTANVETKNTVQTPVDSSSESKKETITSDSLAGSYYNARPSQKNPPGFLEKITLEKNGKAIIKSDGFRSKNDQATQVGNWKLNEEGMVEISFFYPGTKDVLDQVLYFKYSHSGYLISAGDYDEQTGSHNMGEMGIVYIPHNLSKEECLKNKDNMWSNYVPGCLEIK